jgi:nicotinamide mononucleotide adenylyltransferase
MSHALAKIHYQYENFKGVMKEEGLKAALHEAVYFNREMVLVERDLTKPFPKLRQNFDLAIVMIGEQNSSEIEKFEFANKIRMLKSLAYLGKGFWAFLGVSNSKVIAEQWWTNSSNVQKNIIHPDLVWMRLNLKEDEVYAFDLFVSPEYRGTAATNKFVLGYMNELTRAGYVKIFGSYFKDNIASAWFHRVFSFEPLRNVSRYRFFFLEIKDRKICFA